MVHIVNMRHRVKFHTNAFERGRQPSKYCPFPLGIWNPANWFHGPIWVSSANGIYIMSAIFQGPRTWPTHTHTHTHKDIPTMLLHL